MNPLQYHIVPYEPKHNEALLELERQSPQGKMIKLEMLRDDFLSRSEVFEDYSIYVAEDQKTGKIIGVSAIGVVPIQYENKRLFTGFGYDLRVDPAYRKLGISKKLGKKMVDAYRTNQKIFNFFVTLKTSNIAVMKSVLVIPGEWFSYDFIYLTIPTYKRIKTTDPISETQLLSTGLLSMPPNKKKYTIELESGLGIWKTYEMYKLKVNEASWHLKLGSKMFNWFLPTSRKIPAKGDILQFATLYNFNTANIGDINQVLSILQDQKIQYLNVCCTEKDFVYPMLKPYTINVMSYSMLNKFDIKNGNHLTLDVRCL